MVAEFLQLTASCHLIPTMIANGVNDGAKLHRFMRSASE
jgi:hypothetical protein